MRELKMKAAVRCHCMLRSGSEPKILSLWRLMGPYFPNEGLNLDLQQRKHRVLTAGPLDQTIP